MGIIAVKQRQEKGRRALKIFTVSLRKEAPWAITGIV
jgi:hypothetical protein